MNAVDVLLEVKEKVWPVIDGYLKDPEFPKQFQVRAGYEQDLGKYWQMMREYPERKGKYIRPTLLVLVAEALGIDREKAYLTAAAMQLSEDWILLTDDLMDKSKLRRGKPAFQEMYGYEQGVVIELALQAITWKILADNERDLGMERARLVWEEMQRIIMRTAVGQSIEWMWISDKERKIELDDILFIYDSKTGYYSVAGPMRLGAILANATSEQVEIITDFGKAMGTCFQIIDDVLGVEDFGGLKQAGGDIYEGKPTILTAHLFNSLVGKDALVLKEIYAKKQEERTDADVKWVIEKMKESGTLEYAKKKALEYKEQADTIIDQNMGFFTNNDAVSKLKTLANFILERKH